MGKPSKRLRRRRPRVQVEPDLFRETRRAAGLDRQQAADLLGVSLRTIGHWETGACRVPYAPFKLLRILRNGDLIDPAWSHCRLIRGKLVTPENHEIWPHDLAWLSLLVRRASAFSDLLAWRDGRTDGRKGPNRAAAAAHAASAPDGRVCNGSGAVPVSEACRVASPAVVVLPSFRATDPHGGVGGIPYGGVFNSVQVGGATGAAVGTLPPCSNTGRIRSTPRTLRSGVSL